MLYGHRSFLIGLIALFFIPASAQAWGPKGHQIVAYIAEAHLTDTTREKIKAILPKNAGKGGQGD